MTGRPGRRRRLIFLIWAIVLVLQSWCIIQIIHRKYFADEKLNKNKTKINAKQKHDVK
jgi:hypothetical protein